MDEWNESNAVQVYYAGHVWKQNNSGWSGNNRTLRLNEISLSYFSKKLTINKLHLCRETLPVKPVGEYKPPKSSIPLSAIFSV
jgi:hypothetical protein